MEKKIITREDILAILPHKLTVADVRGVSKQPMTDVAAELGITPEIAQKYMKVNNSSNPGGALNKKPAK